MALSKLCLLLFCVPLLQALELTETTRQGIQAGVNCPGGCRFQFCGKGDGFFLGVPGVTFGGRICRRNMAIGNILSVGEAVAFVKKQPVAISQWKPKGLSKRFPKNYFFVDSSPATRGKSTIVRRASKGNQNRFVDGQCFALPIEEFELVKNNGDVVRKRTKGDRKDCVAFQPRAPDVVLQCLWFSGDDLDMEVEEPDGSVVTSEPGEDESTCGTHGGDSGIDACRDFLAARERVQYDRRCDGFQTGTYKVSLFHTSNCPHKDGATRYECSLTVGGRVVRTVKGKSDSDLGKKIATINFKIKG